MRLAFNFVDVTGGAWAGIDEQRVMREFERAVGLVWYKSAPLRAR